MKSSDFKKQFTRGDDVTYVTESGNDDQRGWWLTFNRVTGQVSARAPDGTFEILERKAANASEAKRLMIDWAGQQGRD